MRIVIGKEGMEKLNLGQIKAREVGDVRGVDRIEVLKLIATGMNIPRVADIKGMSRSAIYGIVSRFVLNGVKALFSRKQLGKQPKLNHAQIQELKAIILAGPNASGLPNSCWNLSLVQDIVRDRFGVFLSLSQISRILKKSGLSYKKGSPYLHLRDEQQRKAWLEKEFPDIVRQAKKENAAILFQDEVGFHSGCTGYTWGERGQIVLVPHPGKNLSFKAFGAIDIVNHKFTYHVSRRLNSTTFLDFMKIVKRKYQDQKVIMICDNVNYHKSKKVLSAMGPDLSKTIQIELLPTYSPDYNPIEQLWKIMKGQYFKNFLAKTEDELRKRVLFVFRSVQQKFGKFQDCYTKWSGIISDLTAASYGMIGVVNKHLTDFFSKMFARTTRLARVS